MTFEEFQATKEECSDLRDRLRDETWPERTGGLVYCGCLYIEDTQTWKDANTRARWYTLIGRTEYTSDNLADLERVLYLFAKDEGILDSFQKAMHAAQAEGLRFFWARMHAGHTMQFAGADWEDGGFSVCNDGNPMRDGRGNTVASFEVEDLDKDNPQHVKQILAWYYGE